MPNYHRCSAIMPDGQPCGVLTGKVLKGFSGPKEYPTPVYEYEQLCEFHKHHTNDDLPSEWRRF